MERYIDADKLKNLLTEEDFNTPDERWLPEREIAKLIDAIPTADVEEVVRCRNCQKWNKQICEYHGLKTEYYDFCSYGERRTDNDL